MNRLTFGGDIAAVMTLAAAEEFSETMLSLQPEQANALMGRSTDIIGTNI